MTSIRTRFAIPVAIIAALVIAPTLSGCGLISGLVSKASDGQVQLGGNKVPADFPSDIPLIKGDVIYGLSVNGDDGNKGWNVTIKVDSADAFDEISTELTDAGFTASGDQSGDADDSTSGGVFGNDEWAIVVAVTGDKSAGFVANYTVASADTAK